MNATPELQNSNMTSFSLSSLVETRKETTILSQCDTSKIKADLELIKSDTKEVFHRVSRDVEQLLKDLLVCMDPITMGFCIGYVYPSVVLAMIADIPISLVKYFESVVPLMTEAVRKIIACSQ